MSARTKESLLDEFKKMEVKNNLFEICVDDIHVWELIRATVFKQIENELFDSYSVTKYSDERSIVEYITDGKEFIKNNLENKISNVPESDILYFGGGRRTLHFDNYWWNIYLDPVINNVEERGILMETSYHLRHMKPAKTNNVIYSDNIYDLPNIIFKFISPKKILSVLNCTNINKQNKDIQYIKNTVDKTFKTDVSVINIIRKKAAKIKIKTPKYEKLLDRIDPKLVILAWTDSSLVYACKNKNIPTIKLQKGRRHKFFLKYNYPKEVTETEYFAEYKFVWGDYWKNCVNYPVPDENIISTGFPYLENSKESLTSHRNHKNILFISSTDYGKELSKLAIDLHNLAGDYNIIYKLHPRNEGKIWRELYPWLEDTGITVVDHGDQHLYELFAKSQIQVGVDSTSILEGMYFELDTYLLNHPCSETFEDIAEEKNIAKVDDADDLVANIKNKNDTSWCMNDMFEPRSLQKTKRQIRKILDDD